MTPSSLSSPELTIYLATYRRGIGKPDHWAIVIATSEFAKDGRVFHLVHGRPFYQYRYRPDAKISASSSLKKCAAIGQVNASKIDLINEVLGEIRVVNDNENWNCQTWTREAIVALEGLGYVTHGTAISIDNILAASVDKQRPINT